MFILQSQATIEKAIERAKAIRPRISVQKFGEYNVTGHAGALYTVICARDCNGQKVVTCSCPAGQHGTPCYHAAAVIGLHIILAQAIDASL